MTPSFFSFLITYNPRVKTSSNNHFIKVKCKKYLLRTINSITSLSPKLQEYFKWDAYGTVSGYALTKVWGERKYDNIDSKEFFTYWTEKYIENSDWELRSKILEGFKLLATYCTQWDESFWDALEYFHAPFKGCLEIKIEKTDDFFNAARNIIDIWNRIAISCLKEEKFVLEKGNNPKNALKQREIDFINTIQEILQEVRCKIVDASSFLYDLVNYISKDDDIYKDISGRWKDTLITKTINNMDDGKRKDLKDIIKKLDNKLSNIYNDVNTIDIVKKDIYDIRNIIHYLHK